MGDLAPARPAPFQPPPVVLDSIEFEGYRGTGREFQVTATRADVRTLDRVAVLKDVEIVFVDTGRGSMRVRADTAELDLERDDFILHENVRGSTGNGEDFETSEVRYDPRARLLRSEEAVSVERGTWTLEGKGMEIYVPSGRLSVLEPQITGVRR